MKKVFAILAATVLFAGMASAQLGINVGYAPQTYKTTYTSGSTSTTSSMNLNGFFAGVNYNINLTGDLGVSLGANYRQNFGTDNDGLGIGIAGATVENKHSQSLVDVPILFNYGLKLTDALKLSVFVGPTVSFALAGNTHSTVTTTVVFRPPLRATTTGMVTTATARNSTSAVPLVSMFSTMLSVCSVATTWAS